VQRELVHGILVIELIDFPSVRATQYLPAALVDENRMAQTKGLLQQRIFAGQHAGNELDHIPPRP
jgi:hypothetical protein